MMRLVRENALPADERAVVHVPPDKRLANRAQDVARGVASSSVPALVADRVWNDARGF